MTEQNQSSVRQVPTDFARYTEEALKTESILPSDEKVDVNLLKKTMNIVRNVGTIVDFVKKCIFYRHKLTEENKVKIEVCMTQVQYDLFAIYEFITKGYQPTETVPVDLRLVHGMIGTVGEAGEIAESLLLILRDGQVSDDMRLNIMEEYGDSDWYKAIVFHTQGFDEVDVRQRNLNKLYKRFAGKFSEEKALNRDKEAELEALKG